MLHPMSEPMSENREIPMSDSVDQGDTHDNPSGRADLDTASDAGVGAVAETVDLAASSSWDSTASNVHWIYQRLSTAFPCAEIQVEDTRGDDQHLAVIIASGAFLEKSRIACHQLVYGALDHMRQGKIHAMSLKTLIK